jgi:hypothetical protein
MRLPLNNSGGQTRFQIMHALSSRRLYATGKRLGLLQGLGAGHLTRDRSPARIVIEVVIDSSAGRW